PGKDRLPLRRCRDRARPVDTREVPGGVRVPRARGPLLEERGRDLRRGEGGGAGVTPSPLVQEIVIAAVKIVVVFGGMLGLFSVMTWVARRAPAFMTYRLPPHPRGAPSRVPAH